ncbi:hypothetical protein BS78_03G353800 [Paspalum vaginatum]|nr:hypothetical protein BS78_03G353800 [Paspalum vaginatum]
MKGRSEKAGRRAARSKERTGAGGASWHPHLRRSRRGGRGLRQRRGARATTEACCGRARGGGHRARRPVGEAGSAVACWGRRPWRAGQRVGGRVAKSLTCGSKKAVEPTRNSVACHVGLTGWDCTHLELDDAKANFRNLGDTTHQLYVPTINVFKHQEPK